MDRKLIIFSLISTILVCPLFFLLVSANTPKDPLSKFAMCLNTKGMILACTDYAKPCIEQKNVFNESFRFIHYRNCDFSKDFCSQHSVTRYPVWILPDGSKRPEVLGLGELGRISGCNLSKPI